MQLYFRRRFGGGLGLGDGVGLGDGLGEGTGSRIGEDDGDGMACLRAFIRLCCLSSYRAVPSLKVTRSFFLRSTASCSCFNRTWSMPIAPHASKQRLVGLFFNALVSTFFLPSRFERYSLSRCTRLRSVSLAPTMLLQGPIPNNLKDEYTPLDLPKIGSSFRALSETKGAVNRLYSEPACFSLAILASTTSRQSLRYDACCLLLFVASYCFRN